MDLSTFGFRTDFDLNNKVVKQEEITIEGKQYYVSTVDLGLDHSFGYGEPLYFETMIFPKGSWGEVYCRRYGTREQARDGHEKVINAIHSGQYMMTDKWFELTPREID